VGQVHHDGRPAKYRWCPLRHTHTHTHTHTTILRPFFQDNPGEPVPEEDFWTLCCKGRSTEANTLTIWLGATLCGLTSAHLHHPPIFFTGRMPFLPPNQQCQTTEGKGALCESSIIPFLVPRRSLADAHCWSAVQ